jgi:hypothetical protein
MIGNSADPLADVIANARSIVDCAGGGRPRNTAQPSNVIERDFLVHLPSRDVVCDGFRWNGCGSHNRLTRILETLPAYGSP